MYENKQNNDVSVMSLFCMFWYFFCVCYALNPNKSDNLTRVWQLSKIKQSKEATTKINYTPHPPQKR